jgi:hypothetical protein
MDMRNHTGQSPRSMSVLVWGVILAAILLLMAWIFGIPGFTPTIR